MPLELEIPNDKDFHTEKENFVQKVENALDANMEGWFDQIVIPEVKRMASAMMLPDEFIESIEFKKKGKNRGSVVNTFGSPDVPLAIFFNYGTKRNYKIEPKVTHPEGAMRAARDIEPIGGGSVSHPEWLHWVDEFGVDQFRKKVIHPGFPKTLAMEFGIQQGKNRLMEQMQKLLEGAMT